MRPILLSILLLTGISFQIQAQTAQHRLPDELIRFFSGKWSGQGAFANGQKIEADLRFTLSLDSCWIRYEHEDRVPNSFKALSMWGVDAQSGEFLAFAFDNFHGHRSFTSNGWRNGRLILATQEFYANVGVVYQHFIYEKLSDNSFKMTWETSFDGITWTMGDYLVFTRPSSAP